MRLRKSNVLLAVGFMLAIMSLGYLVLNTGVVLYDDQEQQKVRKP